MSFDKYVLAAAPNWSCSRVCDYHASGIFVFGAKASLFWIKTNVELNNRDDTFFEYQGYIHGHAARIVGVSICHSSLNSDLLVATISEDGKAKVWNLQQQICISEHSTHTVGILLFSNSFVFTIFSLYNINGLTLTL